MVFYTDRGGVGGLFISIFTEGFCKDFVEELDGFHASGLPARRPNSMNNYGVVVNEIGMEPALDRRGLHNIVLPPCDCAVFLTIHSSTELLQARPQLLAAGCASSFPWRWVSL